MEIQQSGQTQNLDISKLPPPPPFPQIFDTSTNRSKLKLNRTHIIVWPVVGAIMLTALGDTAYRYWKKKYGEVYEDWERDYGPQRFSYKDLYKATKGFKDKQLIGKGGFGKVYRGVLPSSNVEIAVKRVSHDSEQEMKEFVAEIVSIGRLSHRNLVNLCGYCRRKGELLLVYDYMPNGSLDKILHSHIKPNINWFRRFRIIRGVASRLLYLHEEWEQVILHRDIKPANVLIDADLNGRLGDFGLAPLHDHGSTLQTTKLVGTIGYMAPELMESGKASTATDICAFGVFMLEVASGRKTVERQGLPEQVTLVDWVTDWKREVILDASDPILEDLYEDKQMELVLKLGLLCSHPNPVARPCMRQVIQYLDGEVMLPDVPSEDAAV